MRCCTLLEPIWRPCVVNIISIIVKSFSTNLFQPKCLIHDESFISDSFRVLSWWRQNMPCVSKHTVERWVFVLCRFCTQSSTVFFTALVYILIVLPHERLTVRFWRRANPLLSLLLCLCWAHSSPHLWDNGQRLCIILTWFTTSNSKKTGTIPRYTWPHDWIKRPKFRLVFRNRLRKTIPRLNKASEN